MAKNKKSFWPYGITIAILAVAIMGAGTIMIALKHPVQMDEAYMKKYQKVDNHINEIKKSQELFDKKYRVIIKNSAFKIGQNSLDIDVVDRFSKRHTDNMHIDVKITRPDDDRFDIKLHSDHSRDNGYIFPSFKIDKKGRWIILVAVSDGKVESYFKKEVIASK